MNFQEELLFERVVRVLQSKYEDNQLIFECAKEWVMKGHKIPTGCVKYYEAYFLNR